MPSRLHFCGLSDIGRNRSTNQDVWAAEPDIGFFALADGMGGRPGGDIAAKEALQILCESIRRFSSERRINRIDELHNAIEEANRWVYQLGSENPELSGMGTTLCCLLWMDDFVYYAHVGDSRIYRLHNDRLELLTRDHSLLARWLATKKRRNNPLPPKNIITRAIGTSKRANPEIACCSSESDDLFLLCSDGLTDALRKDDLQKILRDAKSLEGAAQKMIDCAKIMGSGDNITALMVSASNITERHLELYGTALSRQ